MNLDHKFVAERALAEHCSELLSKIRSPEDCALQVADFAAKFCQALPDRLQPLLVGKRSTASASSPKTQTASSLMQEIGNQSANYHVNFGDDFPALLFSFDLPTGIVLTDRLFGGDGSNQGTVPDSLPISANLALQRIVSSSAPVFLATGSGGQQPAIKSDSNLARLQPFPRGEYCLSWIVEIKQEGAASWSMRIAMLETSLQALLNGHEAKPLDDEKTSAADRTQSGAFADIPLSLHAVLAELQLPLAKLSNLKPGDVLPFAPAREIPLRIAHQTLALGTIGTIDERIALSLTKIH